VALGRLTTAEVAAATGGRITGGRGEREFSGVAIDSRSVGAGELFVAIAGPRFDGHDFLGDAAARGAVAFLIHRDVAAPPGAELVRVADTTRALADLARHVRQEASLPVVAITGSMGKTTTKEMVAALLETRGRVLKTEGNLNNQYGLPLTLLRLRPEHSTAVLELGMSAAGELRLLSGIAQPDLAVITNVAPVHLEFFASLDAIAQAKAEILEGLRPGGVAILNGDDPRLRAIGEASGRRVTWFGRDRRFEVSAENLRGTVFGMRFDLLVAGHKLDVALPLGGPHHVMNFLAAAAVAHQLGVEPEAMAVAAARVTPSAHRGQALRLGGGVTLLDDSYNASPKAVEAALVALSMAGGKRRVAFLGEMRQLGPSAPELHREAGAAASGRADVVVAVGSMALAYLEGARRAGFAEQALHAFSDSTAAAQAAPELVAPGDAILVKGSRGVRMEKVVDALVARLGTVEG
jgi:UDP-N-acetylmuramoyl-tripeptide--D-alanyl-D-alanine ligase